MGLVLAVLVFLFAPLWLLGRGSTEYEAAGFSEARAPFVLVADGDRLRAVADDTGFGEVTNVAPGQPVSVMRTDGRRARLTLTLENFLCPGGPVSNATLAAGTTRWRIPRVRDGVYALRVAGGGDSGSFGLVVGNAPEGDEDC